MCVQCKVKDLLSTSVQSGILLWRAISILLLYFTHRSSLSGRNTEFLVILIQSMPPQQYGKGHPLSCGVHVHMICHRYQKQFIASALMWVFVFNE